MRLGHFTCLSSHRVVLNQSRRPARSAIRSQTSKYVSSSDLAFKAEHGDRAVVKALQEAGGRNVFMLWLNQPENINQMIALILQGYQD